jgi:hypothetical protein
MTSNKDNMPVGDSSFPGKNELHHESSEMKMEKYKFRNLLGHYILSIMTVRMKAEL